MYLDTNKTALFWSKVNIAGPDECWEWQAYKNADGYGKFNPLTGTKLAHRIAYMHANDVVLSSKELACHTCDNPACVNPAHLFIGTNKDNVEDMHSKGRYVCSMSLKTHCKNGHLLEGENLHKTKKSIRRCGICSRERYNKATAKGYIRKSRRKPITNA